MVYQFGYFNGVRVKILIYQAPCLFYVGVHVQHTFNTFSRFKVLNVCRARLLAVRTALIYFRAGGSNPVIPIYRIAFGFQYLNP